MAGAGVRVPRSIDHEPLISCQRSSPSHIGSLAKIFESEGFTLHRQRGDHLIYSKPEVKRPASHPDVFCRPRVYHCPPFSRVFVAKSRRRRQSKARARKAPEAYLTVRRGARPRSIRREERAATRPARGTRRRTQHWRMDPAL